MAHEDPVFPAAPAVMRDQGRESIGGPLAQVLAQPFILEFPVAVVFDIEHSEGDNCTAGIADRSTHDILLRRSEEHTSELQSLMCISYAVFCLQKKTSHDKSSMQYT